MLIGLFKKEVCLANMPQDDQNLNIKSREQSEMSISCNGFSLLKQDVAKTSYSISCSLPESSWGEKIFVNAPSVVLSIIAVILSYKAFRYNQTRLNGAFKWKI